MTDMVTNHILCNRPQSSTRKAASLVMCWPQNVFTDSIFFLFPTLGFCFAIIPRWLMNCDEYFYFILFSFFLFKALLQCCLNLWNHCDVVVFKNYYSLKNSSFCSERTQCPPSDGKIGPYYQNLLWLDLCIFVNFIFHCVKKQIKEKQQNKECTARNNI